MQREGHIGAALAAYAPVAFVTTAMGLFDLSLVGGVAVVGLVMLPDVDLRLPLVPHRGPTHTVWFVLVVAAGCGVVGWTAGAPVGPVEAVGLAAFGATVGGLAIGSHLLADAVTPMGVRPFAPLDDRHISFGLTRAANPLSNLVGLVVGIGIVAGAVGLGRWVAGL